MGDKKKFNQKEYDKKHFKLKTVKFKIEELEDIEAYCKLWDEKKNTLIRKAVMEYIGKPIE